MREKPVRIISAAGLFCLLILVLFGLSRGQPVYYHYGPKDYKVLKWEVQRGTNVSFAMDASWKQWGRRQLDKVGIHLTGERADRPWQQRRGFPALTEDSHIIKVLCEGAMPTPDEFREYHGPGPDRVEYRDGTGSKLTLNRAGAHVGPPGQVWFFWGYNPSEQHGLVPCADSRSGATNLCPRAFRILRKDSGQELLSLRLAAECSQCH
jgi:hypothetical protein